MNQERDELNKYLFNKYGIREIFWQGGNSDKESFEWIYEQNDTIVTRMHDVFNWEDDEIDDLEVHISSNDFLEGLANIRTGENVYFESAVMTDGYTKLTMSDDNMIISKEGLTLRPRKGFNFNSLFLDSFSVIENSEQRKRTGREIILSSSCEAILDLVAKSPQLVYNFSPREFESLIGALLAKMGFSNIKLSRYVKDGGYDLYAIYYEGDVEHTVVIEAKHWRNNKVGLNIVDRLNGVRARENVDKGIIFTSSSFSTVAKDMYLSSKNDISLVDFDKLIDLISKCTKQWSISESGLWSLPANNK